MPSRDADRLHMDTDRERWRGYYRMQRPRAPRELLIQALLILAQDGIQPGSAIDLGCGTGIETRELLSRGWRVLAVDAQEDAIAELLAKVDPVQRDDLQTQVAPFQHAQLPAADLIWAGRSLPFCPPGDFDTVWAKMLSALRPGGRFVGDLFGPRHFWAQRGETQMTIHTAQQVRELCASLDVEYFMEEEGRRMTVTQGVQHWHGFSVVARKP